ncbi:unnamed protein product [Amoebophrya sp. A120]|nr:unnamed protein product [Amoebophrya sp. A120]|eukprot:GSA120T00017638001.1
MGRTKHLVLKDQSFLPDPRDHIAASVPIIGTPGVRVYRDEELYFRQELLKSSKAKTNNVIQCVKAWKGLESEVAGNTANPDTHTTRAPFRVSRPSVVALPRGSEALPALEDDLLGKTSLNLSAVAQNKEKNKGKGGAVFSPAPPAAKPESPPRVLVGGGLARHSRNAAHNNSRLDQAQQHDHQDQAAEQQAASPSSATGAEDTITQAGTPHWTPRADAEEPHETDTPHWTPRGGGEPQTEGEHSADILEQDHRVLDVTTNLDSSSSENTELPHHTPRAYVDTPRTNTPRTNTPRTEHPDTDVPSELEIGATAKNISSRGVVKGNTSKGTAGKNSTVKEQLQTLISKVLQKAVSLGPDFYTFSSLVEDIDSSDGVVSIVPGLWDTSLSRTKYQYPLKFPPTASEWPNYVRDDPDATILENRKRAAETHRLLLAQQSKPRKAKLLDFRKMREQERLSILQRIEREGLGPNLAIISSSAGQHKQSRKRPGVAPEGELMSENFGSSTFGTGVGESSPRSVFSETLHITRTPTGSKTTTTHDASVAHHDNEQGGAGATMSTRPRKRPTREIFDFTAMLIEAKENPKSGKVRILRRTDHTWSSAEKLDEFYELLSKVPRKRPTNTIFDFNSINNYDNVVVAGGAGAAPSPGASPRTRPTTNQERGPISLSSAAAGAPGEKPDIGEIPTDVNVLVNFNERQFEQARAQEERENANMAELLSFMQHDDELLMSTAAAPAQLPESEQDDAVLFQQRPSRSYMQPKSKKNPPGARS